MRQVFGIDGRSAALMAIVIERDLHRKKRLIELCEHVIATYGREREERTA